MESLIFVALAVAWLVYLVPKGLKMHEESKSLDAVQDFSDDLRVVARRDAASAKQAELKASTSRAKVRTEARVSPAAPEVESVQVEAEVVVDEVAAVPKPRSGRIRRVLRGLGAPFRALKARRAAAAPLSAAGRRRRVLGSLLLVSVVVAVLAAFGVANWWAMTAPVLLTAAWLVACRRMVLSEQVRTPRASAKARRVAAEPSVAEQTIDGIEIVIEASEVAEEPHTPYVSTHATPAPGSWDMVPMTLPTYVTKDAAGPRTHTPFDLDSTGVWSSGRSEIDSAIARQAELDEASAREQEQARRDRKLGS